MRLWAAGRNQNLAVGLGWTRVGLGASSNPPFPRFQSKDRGHSLLCSSPTTGITRPSLAAKGSRRKRRRSPEGFPGSSYQENGHREAKVRRRPSPVKGRPKDKHDPSRAGCPCRAGRFLGWALAQVGMMPTLVSVSPH